MLNYIIRFNKAGQVTYIKELGPGFYLLTSDREAALRMTCAQAWGEARTFTIQALGWVGEAIPAEVQL